jgi:hypothetical protein
LEKAEETLGLRGNPSGSYQYTVITVFFSLQKSNLSTLRIDDQSKSTISTTKTAKTQSNFPKALLMKDEPAPPFTETVVTLIALVSGVYRIIVVWLILVIGGVGVAEVIEI